MVPGPTLPPRRNEIQKSLKQSKDRLGRRWWIPVVSLVGALLHAASVWSVVARIGPNQQPALLDSIIYEYLGWYLSKGARLYVDIWEVKPPLVYELTGVIAVMTGDRMILYHWLLVALTISAAILAAVVVGELTLAITNEPMGALVAGLVPFTYPLFPWRTAVGFKPKYFVILFGLLAIYAALRNRPAVSGLFGAASMGFWQLAIVFPVVAMGLLVQRRSIQRLRWFVAGFGLLTVVMLIPVVLWGALSEMLVETVLTPLIAGNGLPLADRIELATDIFRLPSVIVLIGLIGIALLVLDDPSAHWWVAVVAGWLVVQILLIDFDTAPDLLPLFAICAIGVGGVSRIERVNIPPIVALVCSLVVLSGITILFGRLAAGYSWLPPAVPVTVDLTTTPTVPYSNAELRTLFWRPVPPETCRTFFGGLQSRYLTKVGAHYGTDCGAWSPAWDWIKTHWLP